MTRCDKCGQSLLAYAHMRAQRDELLAAAKEVREYLLNGDSCPPIVCRLDAAIANAEGKEE